MSPSATASLHHSAGIAIAANGAPARPRRLKTAVACLTGLVAIAALSHGTDALLRATAVFPEQGQPMGDGLFLLAACYRTLYGAFGCYLSARLTPQRPQACALALGGLGFALSVLGAVATWNAGPEFGPHWYPLALVATALPAGWLGGRLLLWQRRGRAR